MRKRGRSGNGEKKNYKEGHHIGV